MQNKSVKKALKCLYDRCFVSKTVMTTRNLAIICKRFYGLTLVRKREITYSRSTNTYDHCKSIDHDHLLKNFPVIFFKYFGISVSEDSKCLLLTFWLPKLYNCVADTKFIIAAPTCSVEPLLRFITCVSKLICNQLNS